MSALFVLAALVTYSASPAFFSALANSPAPFPLVSTATRAGRLAVFDDAWSTINERYYDRAFRGVDWDGQRFKFRELAGQADSGPELYALLRRMIGALDDPHTRIFSPDEKFDWWHPRFVSIGLAVREIDGLAIVVQVYKNSAPQRAGIHVGDVIEKVNGQSPASVVDQQLANFSDRPGTSSRARALAGIFQGSPGTLVEVSWRDRNGKEKKARFERHWRERELGLGIHRRDSAYVVIEVDAFTKSIAAELSRALKEKLAGAQGIILDLRGNGGGDAEAMADVASVFLGADVSLGEFTDRSGVSFTISTHTRSLFAPDAITQTKLPLVVLTSERTSSAAEIFVESLKLTRRATIIGSETCGCVLAIRTRHALPDGGLLDVSELGYKTANGHLLQGHAVKPDETVPIERSDLYSRHDRAMEVAVRTLKKAVRN